VKKEIAVIERTKSKTNSKCLTRDEAQVHIKTVYGNVTTHSPMLAMNEIWSKKKKKYCVHV